MLRLLGNRKTLCNGLSRRDLLHIGGLGASGVSLPQFLRAQQDPTTPDHAPHFGQAKSCLLIYK